jgi:hypothetical protein
LFISLSLSSEAEAPRMVQPTLALMAEPNLLPVPGMSMGKISRQSAFSYIACRASTQAGCMYGAVLCGLETWKPKGILAL